MPAKQAISVKSPAKHQELTPIENQLLECAKSGKPVLLYGEDTTIDRKNLIYEIHKRAMQKDPNVFVPQKTFKALINWVTEQRYIDCGAMNGTAIKEAIENICYGHSLDKAEISCPFADSSQVPPVNKDYLRNLFFLDNVSCNSQDKGYFQDAGEIVKNYEGSKWIVVFVYNLDNFPDYFLDQFEKKSLEAEKQKEEAEIASSRYKTTNIIPFPTPQGAKWNDLEMSFYEDNLEIVRVTVKEIKEVKNYAEMGFKNSNTGRPNKLWERLLEFRKGNITYPAVTKNKVEKDISRLRTLLKKYFMIKDNPINLKHGYETAFKVNVIEKSNRSVHSFSNYEDEEEKNYLKI